MNQKKPLIGVTPQYDFERNRLWLNPQYETSILRAGGIPLLLPLHAPAGELAALLSHLDGLLFTGGPDIDPDVFGEPVLPGCSVIVPERDRLELPLVHMAAERDLPVFAICRGCQLLNVAFGGTLYQDLPTQLHSSPALCHSQPSAGHVLAHYVQLETTSPLFSCLQQERIRVNSFHHQGICRLAPAFKTAARSDDGLVESCYLPGRRFFLAVQWHPEMLYETDPNAQALFASFLSKCQ